MTQIERQMRNERLAQFCGREDEAMKCECKIVDYHDESDLSYAGRGFAIKYCPVHAAAPDLLEACKGATWLYDQLALGPWEAATKYGPDYEAPTDKECLEIRQNLHDAIQKAEGR